jgi:uncharacterized protein
MSPPPRQIWCVSDGRAGIERQTLAVAHAVAELMPVEIKTIRLSPRAPQVWLPPALWPAPLAALPDDQRTPFLSRQQGDWPDIWIANGRRSIPYSLRAKKWSGGKSLIVQLQDPRISANRFDLVVPPIHDDVSGDNVITTLGAPVWYSQSQITAAQAQFPLLAKADGQKLLVILGGPSKRHRFSLSRAQAIVADLAGIAATGVTLWITVSRRTPADVSALFRDFAQTQGALFFEDEARDGPNPYLAWLSCATHALVTEDSTNMMTDAAFFGLPLHLLRLEGGDTRFDLLHKLFLDRGAARWFSGTLENWRYSPVRDSLDVAQAIVARLTNATI